MKLELTAKQKEAQSEFRAFVNEEIIPYASQCDREDGCCNTRKERR